MQQVIQNIRNGRTLVREIPPPVCLPGHVLVAEVASLISVGTERYVVELARKNLRGKLLDRPDQVRRLLQKVRQEGFRSTFGQAQAKLDEPMTLGYSAAGIVIESGVGVSRFKPGDRVAAAGPAVARQRGHGRQGARLAAAVARGGGAAHAPAERAAAARARQRPVEGAARGAAA